MTRVTVLMAVHNGGDYVAAAVESILAQTHQDLELLVVDDGSTDATADVLRGYDDPRLRVERNARNVGLTRSLDRGLRLVDTELVARQDADDRSQPQRLKRQLALLEERPEVVWCGTWARLVDEDGEVLGSARTATAADEIARLLPERNQFVHGSVLFRRAAVDAAGGYREAFRYAQDYDLSLRLSERHALANVGEELYDLTLHRDRVSLERLEQQQWHAELARRLAAARRAEGRDALDSGSAVEQLLAEVGDDMGRSRYFSYLAEYLWLIGDRAGYRRAMFGLLRCHPHSPRLWGRALLSLAGKRPD